MDSYSFLDNPIPVEIKNKYVEALSHVDECKIENYQSNLREWIENLYKFGNERFAIQSIEYILHNNYRNKDLWKTYIEAMKEKNLKVGVYFLLTVDGIPEFWDFEEFPARDFQIFMGEGKDFLVVIKVIITEMDF